jgi:hypothetical protein
VATQKPVVSVVTGLIQGNIPCKLALQTASTSDSVRILGHKGAETLLGRGDALLKLPDRVQELRVQCAYTSPARYSRHCPLLAARRKAPGITARRSFFMPFGGFFARFRARIAFCALSAPFLPTHRQAGYKPPTTAFLPLRVIYFCAFCAQNRF